MHLQRAPNSEVVRPPSKRERKSSDKILLKTSKSSGAVELQRTKNGIGEVKLKRSPTVNRIHKAPAESLLAPTVKRKRPDHSGNKENNGDRHNLVRPPPNPGQVAETK